MPVVVNSTTDEGCQDGPHSERTASVRARELLSPRASTRHGGVFPETEAARNVSRVRVTRAVRSDPASPRRDFE